YGLKQSAYEWYNTLKAVLESDELQFKRIESDHAVFIIRTELSTVYLALFVDDMAIFGDDEVLIEEIKAKLSSHFKMKDLGIMKRFLGLEIERNSGGDVILNVFLSGSVCKIASRRTLHFLSTSDSANAITIRIIRTRQRTKHYTVRSSDLSIILHNGLVQTL